MIRNSRWFYLGIATISQTALATIHLGIPTLMPLIQAELTLNLTEVGMLVSGVNIGVVVTVLSAGRAADRFGERVIIGYGTIAGGAIVMMVHFAGSFAALLPVFLLLGVPMASGTPAGSKAVAGWFPQKERGTAMGIRQTGIPVGGTIAALVLPSLGLAFGWRFALSAIGLVTIATGVSVLLLYNEPERFPVSRDSTRVGSVRDIIRRKDIWAVTVKYYAAFGTTFRARAHLLSTGMRGFESVNLDWIASSTRTRRYVTLPRQSRQAPSSTTQKRFSRILARVNSRYFTFRFHIPRLYMIAMA